MNNIKRCIKLEVKASHNGYVIADNCKFVVTSLHNYVKQV